MWDTVKILLVLIFAVLAISMGIYLEIRRVNACTTYLHLTTIECIMQGGRK